MKIAITTTLSIFTGIFFLSLMACTTNPEVEAGLEGYVYESPRIFGNGGYQGSIVGPGNFGVSFLRNRVATIDVRPTTVTEVYSILSKDDLKLTLQSHARLQFKQGEVKVIVEEFGGDALYNRSIKKQLRTMVRSEIMKRNGTDVKGQIDLIGKQLTDSLIAHCKNMPIMVHSVVIGNVQYPQSISDAVEAKLKADQTLLQKETQKKIAKADAEIEIEKARGIRQAQSIINKSLTKNYLQYKAIEAQEKMASSPNHTTIYIPVGKNGIPIMHNR